VQRGINSEVLLHGSPATILDRGAALDDEGDRSGPTLGRLPKGVSHERARCLKQHSATRDTPMAEHIRAGGSRREISADLDDCQQDPDERGFGLSCPP